MRKFQTSLKSYLCDVLTNDRLEKGFTQAKMADSLYMTTRSYNELERGKSGFSATTLILFLANLSDEKKLRVIRDFAHKIPEYEEIEID